MCGDIGKIIMDVFFEWVVNREQGEKMVVKATFLVVYKIISLVFICLCFLFLKLF